MEETTDSPPPAETPAQEQSPEKQTDSKNDNVVFIGSKHLMNYVNSIEMQLQKNPEVVVKARGKFISKAVDVVEVARRNLKEASINIKDILINTEEYENEGKKVKVSTIEVVLTK